MEQPFEKYPGLATTIQYGANNWKTDMRSWNMHIAEINATITLLENEINLSNNDFNNFVNWLDERDDTTKNIYLEYLNSNR